MVRACGSSSRKKIQEFGREILIQVRQPRRVPTGVRKACNQTRSYGIGNRGHHNWSNRRCALRGADGADGRCQDYIRLVVHQFLGKTGKALVGSGRPAQVELIVPAFAQIGVQQPLLETLDEDSAGLSRTASEPANQRASFLSARRERPDHRDAGKSDELSSSHSPPQAAPPHRLANIKA